MWLSGFPLTCTSYCTYMNGAPFLTYEDGNSSIAKVDGGTGTMTDMFTEYATCSSRFFQMIFLFRVMEENQEIKEEKKRLKETL